MIYLNELYNIIKYKPLMILTFTLVRMWKVIIIISFIKNVDRIKKIMFVKCKSNNKITNQYNGMIRHYNVYLKTTVNVFKY